MTRRDTLGERKREKEKEKKKRAEKWSERKTRWRDASERCTTEEAPRLTADCRQTPDEETLNRGPVGGSSRGNTAPRHGGETQRGRETIGRLMYVGMLVARGRHGVGDARETLHGHWEQMGIMLGGDIQGESLGLDLLAVVSNLREQKGRRVRSGRLLTTCHACQGFFFS